MAATSTPVVTAVPPKPRRRQPSSSPSLPVSPTRQAGLPLSRPARASSSTSSSKPTLLASYNQKFFGVSSHLQSKSTPSIPSLHTALLHLSSGYCLPPWRYDLPSFARLLRGPFGFLSKNHSWRVEPCFNNILFHVFKSGFLPLPEFENLCATHPLSLHLAKRIVDLSTVDFRHLREFDPNWAQCDSVPHAKEQEFLALLFHYDMNMSAAVRFLGSKYLGGHRDVDAICRILSNHVDPELIADYRRIMTIGCPNKFVAETSHQNAETYRLLKPDPSLARHEAFVHKNLVKEFKNNFAFPLPSWVTRFCRAIFLTPQLILLHPRKPPRGIFDARQRPTEDSRSINMMTSTAEGSELECKYGSVPARLFLRIWNLRISYPDDDIVIHANDVKSCFRQLKHHPDIIEAFSYVLFNHLWIQVGQTFGSDFSPANWEGVRRVIEQLAQSLFSDSSLRDKHRKYLDKLQWDVSLDSSSSKRFVPACPDSQNQGVFDSEGRPLNTPHHVFVDDDIYAEVYIRERVEQAIAASIEAMFITLGESDLTRRADPISWDKLIEMTISHFNKVLGMEINTRKMDVGPPPDFVASTMKLLDSFHEGRKSFTVQEMSSLVGNLSHIANTSRWLTHILSHLYTSISAALKVNKAHEIRTNKAFREALRRAEDSEFVTGDQQTFTEGYINRTVHRSRRKHYLNQTAKEELRLIRLALSSCSLRTPIAHLVSRDPSGKAYGDSSLDAAGGWSTDCRFWWYLEWSQEIRDRTLRFHKNNADGKLININVLEYASIIINYAAMTLYYRQNCNSSDPFPLALLFADNVAAEIWTIKGCKRSLLGRALSRLLCALMIGNPLGISTARIDTHSNIIADEISRLKKEQDSLKFFSSLVNSHPQLRGCRRFLPSNELLSAISEALLNGKLSDPLKLNSIVLNNPGSFTS